MNRFAKHCFAYSIVAVLLAAGPLVAQNFVPSAGGTITTILTYTDPTPGATCTYSGAYSQQTSNTLPGRTTIAGNQGYSTLLWNPLTKNLSACVAPSGATATNPGVYTWTLLVNNGGLASGIGTALASASTITPTNKNHHVTGTTAINTITAPTGVANGTTVKLIFDGVASWTAAGNIAVASQGTIVVGQAEDFTFDTATQKWYPMGAH
jgi:hypothetical protein